MVADAVRIEPVSNPEFPVIREINREFSTIRPLGAVLASSRQGNSMACIKIPYAKEQGNLFADQGINF
jgi:hypothetical protein